MVMFIINPEDVLAGFEQQVSTEQYPLIQDKIEEAELILEGRLGDLDAWTSTDFRQRAIQRVVVRVVQRVLRNPVGARTESETMGPWSSSFTIDPRVASGTVWVTDDDWALLGVGDPASQVGTIRVRHRHHEWFR